MRVYQVPLTVDPLLEEVGRLLADVDASALQATERVGYVPGDLGLGPPQRNRDIDAPRLLAHLPELQLEAGRLCPEGISARAAYYYPPGGGLGWHTNSVTPGWRVYVARPLTQYAISGMITRDAQYPDLRGFAKLFRVSDDWFDSWHAIYAMTPRLSVGLLVPDDRAATWILNTTKGAA